MKRELADSRDLKLYYIYFSNSPPLEDCSYHDALQNFRRNWFNDLPNLLLDRYEWYGHQRMIHRNASKNLSWRFSWYFERVCLCWRWLWSGWKIAFLINWSSWSQNSFAPTFTRSEPLTFLSLGLYERLKKSCYS